MPFMMPWVRASVSPGRLVLERAKALEAPSTGVSSPKCELAFLSVDASVHRRRPHSCGESCVLSP
jgi:hypothetical protein